MRVLHITNAYPYSEYSSYGVFIKEQIRSLEEVGIENQVFFINAKKNGSKEYFRCTKEIKNNIADHKPDIVHCHHEFSLIPMLLLNSKIPIILSLLGDIDKRSNLNKFFYYLFKRKANIVILKNKNKKEHNIRYLPNGVDISFFKPISDINAKTKLKLDLSSKYILFVTARLDNPIKRFDKFEQVLKELNKKNEIVFKPLVMSGAAREDVPLYYNSAEFLLLTSDHEGSPNAVKEAMSCNLPVVSTDVGNVKGLFGGSDGNFLSKTGSIEELVSLSLKALKVGKSKGRKRLVELNLDMQSVAGKLKKEYGQLMTEKSK